MRRGRNLLLRLALSAALFGSVLLLPWWVTLLLAIALCAIANGYEVILAGFLLDILYGGEGSLGLPMPFLSTSVAFVIFAMAFIIKRNFIRQT